MTLRPHVGNCRNFAKKLESPTKKQCQKSIGGNIWKKARTSNNIKNTPTQTNSKVFVDLTFFILGLNFVDESSVNHILFLFIAS